MSGRLAYGSGAFGVAIVYQTLGMVLIYYYTNVVGLTAAQAGTIVFLSTIWDGVADPLIAWAASRTRSRHGQYRPWLLYASGPAGLMFVVMFWHPDWPVGALFGYTFATSMIFRSLFQAVYLPYTALIGQITADANERARLAGWKGWFTSIAQLATAVFALGIVDWFGRGDDRQGFLAMAAIFGALVSGALFVAGYLTHELGAGSIRPNRDVKNPREGLRLILTNRPVCRLLGASVCFGSAYALFSNLTIYLFQYDLHSRSDSRWAFGALAAAGLIAAPFWSMVAVRRGKRFVWLAGVGCTLLALLALWLVAPHTTRSILPFYALFGFGTQPLIIMQFAALADAVDFGEWRSGARVSAFSFGMLTFANKAALAVGGGAAGALLSWVGFMPQASPSANMLGELRSGMLLLPAALFALSAWIMFYFEVTTKVHQEARAAIEHRMEDSDVTI